MKCGQLMERNKRNIFSPKLCGKEGRETSFCFDKKSLYEVKASGL